VEGEHQQFVKWWSKYFSNTYLTTRKEELKRF